MGPHGEERFVDDKKKFSLEDSDMITERPIGRRASVAVVGAVLVGAAGIVATTPSQAEAQGCSDSDPRDAVGRGRHCGVSGCSDSDPHDPGGNGRHCRPQVSGCSDSDPRDPGGNGRHCGRRSCSDADPYDPAGGGRHC